MRSLALRVAATLRDAWLVVGLAVLMITAAEVAFRGQAAARRVAHRFVQRAPQPVRHPYTDSVWFSEYQREWDASNVLIWSPYVYFRRAPVTGQYITVDSARHRRSVQQVPTGAAVRPVYFFGGSTMWGTGQRDAYTISSVAASRLARDDIGNVVVTNFGETGYVFTQELLTLMLELRAGARPAVVVFYDGINDVGAALENRSPGIPGNESNRAREFKLGRIVFSDQTSLTADVQVARELSVLAANRLQLLSRLRQLGHPSSGGGRQSADSLATDFVHTYVETAKLVEALGAAYGFQSVYVWQPTLQVTPKPLSPFEQAIVGPALEDPFWRQERALFRATPASLRSAMQAIAPKRFLDLSTLFEGDTSTLFLDQIGHTTESANLPIVDAMIPAIEAILRGIRPR